MLRIIDNKRVDITDDEFKAYQDICKSYDRPNFEGKDLFKDLFETNDKGIITFLKPPGSNFISMEVLTFLQSLMLHQHLRLMYDEIDAYKNQMKDLIHEDIKFLKDELKQLKAELKLRK